MDETPDTKASEAPASVDQRTLLWHALVGLLLESERRLARSAAVLDESVRDAPQAIEGAKVPGSRRLGGFLAREMARSEARGREEIERLAAVGRSTEQQATDIAQSTYREVADSVIDEMVALAVHRVLESPAIRQVVREESSSIVEDLVDHVHTRALGADDAAERVARRVFRHGRPRPAPADATLPPAGFVSRAIAFGFDAWLLTLGVGAGGYVASTIIGALVPRRFGVDITGIVPAAIGGLIVVVYFLVCWAAWGRTIGDALLGLRVVTRDGGSVSLPRSIGRYAMFLVSTAAVLLGLLWVLIDDRRLGWFDHVAGTQVVAVPRSLGRPGRTG